MNNEKRSESIWRNELGSVSLFLTIVFAAVFIFVVVLIELARIHAAGVQVDQAIRAGARSVLSEFDPIWHKYGLYALDTRMNSETALENVLRTNLTTEQTEDGLILVNPRYDEGSVQIHYDQPLASAPVLKRQILEEMKYRAPIAIVLDVVNKFKKTDMLTEMKEASRYANLVGQFQNLFNKREGALDRVWRRLDEWIGPGGIAERMHYDYSERLYEIDRLAQEIGFVDKSKVMQEIGRLSEQIGLLNKQMGGISDPEMIRSYQMQISALNSKIRQLNELLNRIAQFTVKVLEIEAAIALDQQKLATIHQTITNELEKAKEHNRQLFDLISKRTEYDAVYEEPFKDIPVLGAEYFFQFESHLGGMRSQFRSFAAKFDPELIVNKETYQTAYLSLQESILNYAQRASDWYAEQNEFEQQRKMRNEQMNNQEAAYNSSLTSSIQKLKQLVYTCPNSETDKANYERVKSLERKYNNYNDSKYNELDFSKESDLTEEPQFWRKEAFDMLEQFNTLLYGLRDDWFIHEYTLSYFNYRTYGGGNQQVANRDLILTDPSRHLLPGQEAEYVTYGFHSCAANQSAAFAELFTLRLGIRFIEEMTSPEKGFTTSVPWLTVLWATAEAGKKAYDDVKQLVDGENVVLSAKLPSSITLNYKDYLRLFMILHAREQPMLVRLQTLLELNTGKDLTKTATGLQLEASAKLPIWFLNVDLLQEGEQDKSWLSLRRSFYLNY